MRVTELRLEGIADLADGPCTQRHMHVVERIERVHEFVGLVEVRGVPCLPTSSALRACTARARSRWSRLPLGPDGRERVPRARNHAPGGIHRGGVARRTAGLLLLAQARRGNPRRHVRVEPVARASALTALGGETEVVPLPGAHVQAEAPEPAAHVAQQRRDPPAVEHECSEPIRQRMTCRRQKSRAARWRYSRSSSTNSCAKRAPESGTLHEHALAEAADVNTAGFVEAREGCAQLRSGDIALTASLEQRAEEGIFGRRFALLRLEHPERIRDALAQRPRNSSVALVKVTTRISSMRCAGRP